MIYSEFFDVPQEIREVIHRALPRFLLWHDESKSSERESQSISKEFFESVGKTDDWTHENIALDLFALPRGIFECAYDEENEYWHLKEFPRFFAKTKEVLNIALCLTLYIIQKSIKQYTPATRSKNPYNEPVENKIYIEEYPEVFFYVRNGETYNTHYFQEKFTFLLFNKLYLGFSFPKVNPFHLYYIVPAEAPISLCTLYLVHELNLLYFAYIFRHTLFPTNKTNTIIRFMGKDQIIIAGTCQDEAARNCIPERQNLKMQVQSDALPYTVRWKNSEWCIEFIKTPTESINFTEIFTFKPDKLSYFEFKIFIHVKVLNEKLISCWAKTSLGDTFFATWKSILKDVELVNYSNLKMRNVIIALANTAFMKHDHFFLNLDFVLSNFKEYKIIFKEYLELYMNKKNIEERELSENFLCIDEYKKVIVIEKDTKKMKCSNDVKKENFRQWYLCLEKTCSQARSYWGEYRANHPTQPHKENTDSNTKDLSQISNRSEYVLTNEEIIIAWNTFLSKHNKEYGEEKFYFQIVQYLLEKKSHKEIIEILEHEKGELATLLLCAKKASNEELGIKTKVKNISNYIKTIRIFAKSNNLPMPEETRGRR